MLRIVNSRTRGGLIGGGVFVAIVVAGVIGILPKEPPPAGLDVCNHLEDLKIFKPLTAQRTPFAKVDRTVDHVASEIHDLAPDVTNEALRSKARAFVRSVRESEATDVNELAFDIGDPTFELLDACDNAGFIDD
jgi:hypothetical protein